MHLRKAGRDGREPDRAGADIVCVEGDECCECGDKLGMRSSGSHDLTIRGFI